MATFLQYGRALLSALFFTTLVACGPGTGDPDGGECPLNGCPNPDGGDGGDAGTPTAVELISPTDANPTRYLITAKSSWSETLPPLACGQESCVYTVQGHPAGGQGIEGAEFIFTPEIPGFLTVTKSRRGVSYTGQRYTLTWKEEGDCGIDIGDQDVGDGFDPYRDEDHSDWGKVYFRTEVACKGPSNDPCSITKVVLNDYGGVGAHKLLGGDNFVVVTGLSFSGKYTDSSGLWSQEFSGTISSDRETITYHLIGRDGNGNITDDVSGVFRRFHS